MNELWRRLAWFRQRERFESELEEEMRHHLALKAEEQGSAGAAAQFGNVTLLKENSRAMWNFAFLEQLKQDLRYAMRAMAANKLFTAMAVGSLALGIGANTAIYSFMDAILIRALPVRHPEELVILNWRAKGDEPPVVTDLNGSNYRDGGLLVSNSFPYPAYEFFRGHNESFSQLFGYKDAGRLNLVADGTAELGEGAYVSGGYFAGLGVRAAAGKLIGMKDDLPGATPVVTITYNLWQRRFGGQSGTLGKVLLINGQPFLIAGIAPPEFFGVDAGSAPQVFIPIRLSGLVESSQWNDPATRFSDPHFYWMGIMGRLKTGVSLQQAQSQLAGQFNGWVSATANNEKERLVLPSLSLAKGGAGTESLRRQYSKPLYLLMAMVALILTVACANLANLLLARSAARRREMAVRLSLGAGRFRIIRQMLTESLLLSVCGGLMGIVVAAAGIRALTLMLANGQPDFTLRAQLDWRVLLFTLVIALASGMFFGLAPALQATRVDITPALKETRASNPRARKGRLGIPFGLSHVLVVWQIASALMLVSAAGLFVRTLANLHAVDVGFNQQNILLFSVNPAQAGYKGAALSNLYRELQQRFGAVPGVRSATMTHMPLVSNSWSSTGIAIPGLAKTKGRGPQTAVTRVGTKFFETMQMPILQGRAIDERDRNDTPTTAVVNEVFAKKYFPGISAVGRHFSFGGGKDAEDVEIVGICRTARYNSLRGEIPPVAYTSYLQTGKGDVADQLYFELRTAGEPLTLAQAVYRIVQQVAPKVPVADMTTQGRSIEGTFSQERTFADLCTCFGALSLLMACIGLYGMMAYAVTRRTSEIGIRMALGAARGRMIWMVLHEVMVLAVVGLMIGSAAVWQTTAVVKSFLFGMKPNDPLALGVAAGILLMCALAAGYVPAWRASQIDPMVAVRHE
jgi:predicted permease